MTIAETYQKAAIAKKEAGELNEYETGFVESMELKDKKELRKLTKNQFMLLRKIAEA